MKHNTIVKVGAQNIRRHVVHILNNRRFSLSYNVTINFARSFQSSVMLNEEKKGILGKLKTIWRGSEKSDEPSKQEKPQETPTQQTTVKTEKEGFEKLGEEAAKATDPAEQSKLEESIQSGKFDLNDFKTQLKQFTKMGGMAGMLKYMPAGQAFKQAMNQAQSMINKDDINTQIRIIDAMTEEERKNPSLLASKAFKAKQRIAQQANASLEDVNRVLKKYEESANMMKTLFEMRKKGQPIPNSMEDIMKLMMKSKGINF